MMRNLRDRLILGTLGVIALALAIAVPVYSQAATRLFATLSTNLTTGTSTPLTCTASGAGCFLDVSVGGGTFTPDALCVSSAAPDWCITRASAGTASISVGTTLRYPDGTAASPAIAFNNDTGMGLIRVSSGNMGFVTAATVQVLMAANKIQLGSGGAFGFASTSDASGAAADTQMKRGASATLVNFVDAAGTTGIQLNSGSAAPTISSCGTGTITAGSRNSAGQVTATGVASCGIAFATPAWTNAPFCTMSNQTAARGNISSVSTTILSISNLTAGDVVTWNCLGRI